MIFGMPYNNNRMEPLYVLSPIFIKAEKILWHPFYGPPPISKRENFPKAVLELLTEEIEAEK